MVADKHENRVLSPCLLLCLLYKLADAVIGIFNDLLFRREFWIVESFGDNVGRVVADGQQCGEKRSSAFSMFPQDGKGVREEKIVGHSEMVDHLLLGIVFLRIYLVISVGAEEGVHVVVLALVCHEKHGVISVFLQNRRQSRILRDVCSFHCVAEHDRWERIERGVKTVVCVIPGRVAVVETE